jgi:lysophospholipase L1-like esterase
VDRSVRKIAFFRLLLFVLVLLVFIAADFGAGLIRDTSKIRQASGMFRGEAAPLYLKTRHLLPNRVHRYELTERNDPMFPGGADDPRLFRTDELGTVIGPRQETGGSGAAKILFLGGSTTETNEVDEPFRFPWRVGELLSKMSGQTFVGLNQGVRGNTSRDSINVLLNHPVVQDADYIVMMHNINDRLLLASGGSYDARLNDQGEGGPATLIDSTIGLAFAIWDFISYRSNILFLLRYKVFEGNPWIGEHIPLVVNERTIDYDDEHLERSANSFSANLRVFVAVANALGKRPILMTQPLGRPSSQQEKFNDVIRNVAHETDTALIDLQAVLPKDRRELFLSDDIHFSNEGSRMVADIVAQQLGEMLLGIGGKRIGTRSGSFEFDRCLIPPETVDDITVGPRHLLLRVSGRYPVFSRDERYVFFQSWTGKREILNRYDRVTSEYRQLFPEHSDVQDRHATVISVNKEDAPLIAFGRSQGGTRERIYVMRMDSSELEQVPIPEDLSGSIPAHGGDGKILFAGARIDAQGKPMEAPDLYYFDAKSRTTHRLTRTAWEEWRPVMTPDGRQIYYIGNPKGNFDIYRLDVDTGETAVVFGTSEDEWDPDISRDGRWLVFASKSSGNWNLYLMDLLRLGRPIQLTANPSDDWDPRFLPQSNAIVFASSANQQAPFTYYLCPFGEQGKKP